MKSSCCVADQNIRISGLGCCHRIIDNRCRVCTVLSADDLNTCTVSPLCQLFSCCRTEGICRTKDHFLSLILQFTGKFTNGGSLTDSVDTDHQDHGFPVLEFIFCALHLHLLLDTVDQKLLALGRLFDMLFSHLFLQVLQNGGGCVNADVSHDQDLFQFFVKIIVNAGKAAENGIKTGNDIISRFGKAAYQTFKKSFFFFCHTDSSPLSLSKLVLYQVY